jgi:hypothetical protein
LGGRHTTHFIFVRRRCLPVTRLFGEFPPAMMRTLVLPVCLLACVPLVLAISVPRCPPVPPPISARAVWEKYRVVDQFTNDWGPSYAVRQQTSVSACHTHSPSLSSAAAAAPVTGSIRLFYAARANDAKSPWGNASCNEPLYEHDAVEAFLAVRSAKSSTEAAVHRYLETELAPTGALFLSQISNPDLTCAGIRGSPVACNSSGVVHEAVIDKDAKMWYGLLDIPLSLIAQASRDARGSAAAVVNLT